MKGGDNMFPGIRSTQAALFLVFQLLLILQISTALILLPATILSAKDETNTICCSPDALNLQQSFARVARLAEPVVVNISMEMEQEIPSYQFFFGTPFEEFFNQQEAIPARPRYRKVQGIASGVIITADGYILTNEHVVHGAKSLQITLSDQKKYPGRIVGRDELSDIAIIKINAGRKLPYAALGDSDKINVGDWAIAIGSPFGLQETVTVGVISALRQSIPIEGKTYKNLIQTDAAINRGNSGGPLCNVYGQVVGINTAIFTPSGAFAGIGFAIPINSAKEIMESLIHKGKVVRGWLGVEIRSIDEAIAKQFHLPDTNGVLINNAMANTPASKAGLERGDVIREINGRKISSAQELQSIIEETAPNKKIALKIFRAGKEMDIKLITGEMPAVTENVQKIPVVPPAGETSAEWLGMKVETVTDSLRKRFNIPGNEQGCIVTSVQPESTAESIGLLPGDLIRAINQMPTPTVQEFKRLIQEAKLSDGIVFDINRQGNLIYLSFMQKRER